MFLKVVSGGHTAPELTGPPPKRQRTRPPGASSISVSPNQPDRSQDAYQAFESALDQLRQNGGTLVLEGEYRIDVSRPLYLPNNVTVKTTSSAKIVLVMPSSDDSGQKKELYLFDVDPRTGDDGNHDILISGIEFQVEYMTGDKPENLINIDEGKFSGAVMRFRNATNITIKGCRFCDLFAGGIVFEVTYPSLLENAGDSIPDELKIRRRYEGNLRQLLVDTVKSRNLRVVDNVFTNLGPGCAIEGSETRLQFPNSHNDLHQVAELANAGKFADIVIEGNIFSGCPFSTDACLADIQANYTSILGYKTSPDVKRYNIAGTGAVKFDWAINIRVQNNQINDVGAAAIRLEDCFEATVDHNEIEQCNTGIALMYYGWGHKVTHNRIRGWGTWPGDNNGKIADHAKHNAPYLISPQRRPDDFDNRPRLEDGHQWYIGCPAIGVGGTTGYTAFDPDVAFHELGKIRDKDGNVVKTRKYVEIVQAMRDILIANNVVIGIEKNPCQGNAFSIGLKYANQAGSAENVVVTGNLVLGQNYQFALVAPRFSKFGNKQSVVGNQYQEENRGIVLSGNQFPIVYSRVQEPDYPLRTDGTFSRNIWRIQVTEPRFQATYPFECAPSNEPGSHGVRWFAFNIDAGTTRLGATAEIDYKVMLEGRVPTYGNQKIEASGTLNIDCSEWISQRGKTSIRVTGDTNSNPNKPQPRQGLLFSAPQANALWVTFGPLNAKFLRPVGHEGDWDKNNDYKDGNGHFRRAIVLKIRNRSALTPLLDGKVTVVLRQSGLPDVDQQMGITELISNFF